ncbi:hypothetical protein LTR85_002718 [Meristemomyces frigidus]|nr:hypothetical protein LTR85_002718 [Meristemomyces frigidus]
MLHFELETEELHSRADGQTDQESNELYGMMATPLSLSDAVRATLSDGTASASTVTTLQSLLAPDRQPGKPEPNDGANAPTVSVKGRTTKGTGRKVAAKLQIPIHEDKPKPTLLPPKAKYALATEVVNTTLKALTATTKPRSKASIDLSAARNGAPSPGTPRTHSRATSISSRALQPRSGNATPIFGTPAKSSTARKTPVALSSGAISGPSAATVAAAECARLAFAYLRSVNAEKLSIKSMPGSQLEAGTLALVARLLALGLDVAAIKELRIVKRRLQAAATPNLPSGSSQAESKLRPTANSDRETLASLLQLDPSIVDTQALLQVAITYQQLVLKAVVASGKPAVIENAVQYLSMECATSPANLIERQGRLSGEVAKTAKQLEALAQTLLSLCPSVSAAQDSAAIAGIHAPSPTTAFALQILALRIRRSWWSIAGHEIHYEKDLAEPFARCLSAFARRSIISGRESEAYASAQKGYAQLDLDFSLGVVETSFIICRTFTQLADSSKDQAEALRWADQTVKICVALEPQNARSIASLAKQASLIIKAGAGAEDIAAIDGKLNTIVSRLRDQLSGHTADYDLLLAELTQLVSLHTKSAAGPAEAALAKELVWHAASFAQRYARSYPNKGATHTQAILFAALRCSKASEDFAKWITRDAANILIQAGVLQAVVEAADSKPLTTAWSTSSAAIALDRVLHALLLKAMKAGSEATAGSAYDDEALAPMERAVMLERQLVYAMELADRSKYHTVLQRIVHDTLRTLSKLYVPEVQPIRRARVAIIALELRGSHPNLLPPHSLKVWLDAAPVDPTRLLEDERLGAFAEDVKAGLEITRALHFGRPAIADLKPALLAWQRFVEEATSAATIAGRVDRPEMLLVRLKSIASYLRVMGNAADQLPTLRMVRRLSQLLGVSTDEQTIASIELAQQYLELGFSEKAGHTLAQAQKLNSDHDVSHLVELQLRLAYADYLLAIDNMGGTSQTLTEAKELRLVLPPENVARGDRKTYELVHAQGWLIQSKLSLDSGAPHEALAAAKSAVKVLNSAWASIERSSGRKAPDPATDPAASTELEYPDAVTGLATGISKLQLTPKESEQTEKASKTENGAAFWPILPIMTRALLQLSEMYAHHGLFAEADYYSQRAISLVESTGSGVLLSRIRTCRSKLLALAGKLEEAELCLSKSEEHSNDGYSMARVELYCVKADIRAREGSFEEASQLYQKALLTTKTMQEVGFLQHLERLAEDDEALQARIALLSVAASQDTCEAGATVKPASGLVKTSKPPSSRSATIPKTQSVRGRKLAEPEKRAADTPKTAHYLLDRCKLAVSLEIAMVSLHSGEEGNPSRKLVEQLHTSTTGTLRQRHLHFQQLMRRAATSLQSDMSYSMLPESTLSFPALVRADRRLSEHGAPRSSLLSSAQKASAAVVAPAKTAPRKKTAAESVSSLLLAARECLAGRHTASLQISSTADIYHECLMLSNVSMLLSAAGIAQSKGSLHPVREALHIEQPRMNALRCEAEAIRLDHGQHTTPFSWPEVESASGPAQTTAAAFQEQYIDILPKPWTTVSLSLNDDGNELYVTRYRSGQSPLILRLPFSRHKQEDDDQEVFDYHTGKAELQDIIQISNYSCHNTGTIEAKGAKSNWWSEREALDKRLHELLINVENIWLGGFKGVFSQYPRQPDLLARFRKSIEDVLARYLPSRQTAKGRPKPLRLDDKVLELFIGLGTDQDGVVDLDEPLADLLYFTVDMLQFNGERNAYDEIDFDSMAVDVLDALRSYHEACPDNSREDQHLILILDKRLQAFPWESLPCLESASVSRVGSMLSLRHRILAMKRQAGCHVRADNCYRIGRSSGAYILNPSQDLASTQSTLSAPLSKLTEAKGSKWTSMVQQVPSEDEFRTALTDSSMLLYFGHGSGAQYIRPRTIRKLDRCSEVVWLMGCSSGAVTEHGELEPSAVPLAYLMAGNKELLETTEEVPTDSEIIQPCESDKAKNGVCMAVVATLWDVTDKDIDRFSLAVGEEWALWPASEASKLPTKTPKKRDLLAAPSTPQQVPKTPKARKTPAPAKTPARSRSRPRQEAVRKKSLVEAVARSRDACYLRYLNGAAPVVYGVPVYMGD